MVEYLNMTVCSFNMFTIEGNCYIYWPIAS